MRACCRDPLGQVRADHRSARGGILLTFQERRNIRLLVGSGCVILGFLFVWFEFKLLLLAFAGVLLAVILRAITGWIERRTRLNGATAYAATLLLLGAAATGIGVLLAPRTITEISEVVHTMPSAIQRLEAPLERTATGRAVIHQAHKLVRGRGLSSHLPEIATNVGGSIADLVLVVVIGFFAALSPRGYREGVLLLIPENRRSRVRTIAGEVERQMKWWLLGQMVPMAALGVTSGIGLWLLGVPMAWTLGLLTGLAVFLPYAGTILAGIPSVLMGLERSPRTAIWVLILYTLLHVAEGYFLTPLVQKRAVRLPPVLTVLVQYFLWTVAGVLGLAMAAPLAGAGIVLVKELYLHVPPDQSLLDEAAQSSEAA